MADDKKSIYDSFISRAKKQKELLNKFEGTYVPLDVFRTTVELSTENMRQLYAMLHEMNMEKGFSMEMDLGGIKFVLAGSEANSENVILAAEKMIELLTSKFYTKNDMEKLMKENKRKDVDEQKSYR
jgi:CRISPR/Cas system CSM-associated protein Csm2 small subunit